MKSESVNAEDELHSVPATWGFGATSHGYGIEALLTPSCYSYPFYCCCYGWGLPPTLVEPHELPLLPPKPLGASAKLIWLFGAAL